MTERDALLRGIIDDPDDDAPRLVYADWLDENGEANGTFDVLDYIALCRNHYEQNGVGADYIDKLFR